MAKIAWAFRWCNVTAVALAAACHTPISDSGQATDAAASIGDGTEPPGEDASACVEPWCAQLKSACEALYGLCPVGPAAPPLEGRVRNCTNEAGERFRATAVGESAALASGALESCQGSATTCATMNACLKSFVDSAANGGHPRERPDAASGADGAFLPDGSLPLATDDVACLRCAYDRCTDVISHCFTNTPQEPSCRVAGGKPYPDCCRDYRACRDRCSGGVDAGGIEMCAAECDRRYPHGKNEYLPYIACVNAKCASCSLRGGK
jgi:hypothetical protein